MGFLEPKNIMNNDNEWLTISEACSLCGKTRLTVQRWIDEQLLPATKFNKKHLIKKTDFQTFVKEVLPTTGHLKHKAKEYKENYYTFEEVAILCGVNKETLKNWYRKGLLDPIKPTLVGRTHLFKKTEILPFISEHTTLIYQQNYCTVNEAATMCGVNEFTVRKWIYSGLINATKVGRTLMLEKDKIEKFIAKHSTIKLQE
jgi:excisionase family DNA binding protein